MSQSTNRFISYVSASSPGGLPKQKSKLVNSSKPTSWPQPSSALHFLVLCICYFCQSHFSARLSPPRKQTPSPCCLFNSQRTGPLKTPNLDFTSVNFFSCLITQVIYYHRRIHFLFLQRDSTVAGQGESDLGLPCTSHQSTDKSRSDTGHCRSRASPTPIAPSDSLGHLAQHCPFRRWQDLGEWGGHRQKRIWVHLQRQPF